MTCFDGGVAHEAPIDPWLDDDGIDLIVMHRVTHTEAPPPRLFPFNFFHLASKAHECASEQLQEYRIRLAALHGKKILVTRTVHSRPVTFSGKEMPSYYAAGEAQAQNLYDTQLKDLL
jgi:NTE family protein